MELSKLESIFKDIWEHDGDEKKKARPYHTKFQKVTFRLMLFFFVSALLVALSTWVVGPYQWQKFTALLLVALCQLTSLAYQLSFVFDGIKIFKAPARHFLEPVTKSSARDYGLANSMARFKKDQLSYAKNRLELEKSQMVGRTGFLVGAIEKVGIIPVSVTWFIAAHKFVADKVLDFGKVDLLVYGLMGIYMMAMFILSFVHKLERYILVIDAALNIKESNEAA